MVLLDLLLELTYKILALQVVIWAARYLTREYLEAVLEFTRAYLTIVELIYSRDAGGGVLRAR